MGRGDFPPIPSIPSIATLRGSALVDMEKYPILMCTGICLELRGSMGDGGGHDEASFRPLQPRNHTPPRSGRPTLSGARGKMEDVHINPGRHHHAKQPLARLLPPTQTEKPGGGASSIGKVTSGSFYEVIT